MPEQTIRVHGPYEDAMIAGFELAKEIVEGQTPEVKRELWTRWLEATKPLHEATVEAAKNIQAFIRELTTP